MKKITHLLFLIFCSANIFAQQAFLTLNYDSDKSKITATHLSQLETFFTKISFEKIEQINIVGHTDTTANLFYNQNLSKKRAANVQVFFLSKGISSDKIQLSWQGETQAISPKNLREDRRVIVEVFFPIKRIEVVEEVIEEEKPILETPISDFFKQTIIPVQAFYINPKKDTIIQCAQGTIINIKANSFALNSIQSRNKSCIQFQVKEVFLFSDMLLENLTTTADGQILETQGMIYTNAMLENDTLELKKDLTILLPTDEVKEGVKVFDGVRDPHSDVVNWSLNNNSVLRNFNVFELANCLKFNSLTSTYCLFEDEIIGVPNERRILNCLYSLCRKIECPRCKIIFCRFPKRIHKPFQGMFNKFVRKENKAFRECQRRLRRLEKGSKKRNFKDLVSFAKSLQESIRSKVLSGEKIPNAREKEILELTDLIMRSDSLIQAGLINTQLISKCDEIDNLFKEYKVENIDDLLLAINRPLLDEFKVKTMEALLDTLPKVNLENLEVAYRNETISFDDYKFYIFNTSNFGWKNLDIFADIPEKNMVKMKIKLTPSPEVDCKLVIRERAFVLPAKLADEHFYFDGIPKNEEAWIIAIKYQNGQPMLAMKEIIVKKKSFDLEFKSLTLEELKEQLKVLDFKE